MTYCCEVQQHSNVRQVIEIRKIPDCFCKESVLCTETVSLECLNALPSEAVRSWKKALLLFGVTVRRDKATSIVHSNMATNSSKGRMPSLNELAAKMNINNPTAGQGTITQSSSGARPRLAASFLRTGSTTSINTSASTATTADSMAVNAPSTRSGSPLTVSSGTPPASNRSSYAEPNNTTADSPPSGEPLTSDKLDQLNKETGSTTGTIHAPVKLTKVGYKNIPSLDAITARLAKARTLSVDGSAKPPDAQMIEDPKTPGVPIKAPEHPLQYTWYVSYVIIILVR